MEKFFDFCKRKYGMGKSDALVFILTIAFIITGGYKYLLLWVVLFMQRYRQSACNLWKEELRSDFNNVYDGLIGSVMLYYAINRCVDIVASYIR